MEPDGREHLAVVVVDDVVPGDGLEVRVKALVGQQEEGVARGGERTTRWRRLVGEEQ